MSTDGLRALLFSRLDDDQLRCLVDLWIRLDPAAGTSRDDDATSGSTRALAP